VFRNIIGADTDGQQWTILYSYIARYCTRQGEHRMPKARARKQREPFGRIRRLPSGRYQAGYVGPDLALHHPSGTFETIMDARAWLASERRSIDRGTWAAPAMRNIAQKPATLRLFAEAWLTDRQLKPRTRALYRSLLDQKILPELGDIHLKDITSLTVREWYSTLDADHPTRRAHAYGLLRTILSSAVIEDLIASNPCHIRGASNSKRVHQIKPATLPEIERIITALPDRYGLMVLLASWCALRFGELIELRRKDLDLKAGKIMIRRAAVYLDGKTIIGEPKSSAGTRDVAIPPHLLPAIKQHLNDHAAWGKDGLVFPSTQSNDHLVHGAFYKTWESARKAAGRPDLRFHDLRHTGAVLAAQTGATLAELMNRLGHSTPAMAIRYQHVAQDRDAEIARRLSAMVEVGQH
jgi:integrase